MRFDTNRLTWGRASWSPKHLIGTPLNIEFSFYPTSFKSQITAKYINLLGTVHYLLHVYYYILSQIISCLLIYRVF